jgi:TonB family protein
MLLHALFLALLAVMVTLQAAPRQGPSRGITADGRVITSPYGVPPPWGRDVTHFGKPHYPESLRTQHPVISGFFRIIFDLTTGRVRRVMVEESSGYPAGDASIIAALQQWHLRPNTWREFQVHVSIGLGKKPEASNQSMKSQQPQSEMRSLHSTRDCGLSLASSMMKTRIIVVVIGAVFFPSLVIATQSVAYAPDTAEFRAGLLSWEAPAYPFRAKLHRCQGRALFRVTINPATGAPAQIVRLKSTGFGILDDSAVLALRTWRWKPGTRGQFDIPINFTLSRDLNSGKPPVGSSRLPQSPR